MHSRMKVGLPLLACVLLASALPMSAQQKGQYVPGQYGLNAGVIPAPGISYFNWVLNYSASRLNNSSGSAVRGISGTYSFWVDENIFVYVPNHKFLGAHYVPYFILPVANGSLVADLPVLGLNANAGGAGLADVYTEPVNFGWHLKRIDINAGYGFIAPVGRYTPGASNNVGSGYWGNNITSGTTVYLTKNKATTANLFGDWEIHGQKQIRTGGKITPGQAFTDEWGLGQVIPLKKDFSRLLQLGVIGYDQWQVTSNSGPLVSRLPYYSVHAIGFQSNFILPAKNLSFFFKYENEYLAKARPQGRLFTFGANWTLRIPKPKPKAP